MPKLIIRRQKKRNVRISCAGSPKQTTIQRGGDGPYDFFPGRPLGDITVSKSIKWATKKASDTFHYTGCLVRNLIMVSHNPNITG